MTFGEKLLKLRKSKRISQEQLACQIGVSRQAISKWETGMAIPDTENVLRIGQVFNVPTEYLLNDDIENEQDIPIVNETYSVLHKCFKIKVISIILIFIGSLGIIISLLLTSFIQRNEMSVFGSMYTNALFYLGDSPLIFLILFSVFILLLGFVLLYKSKHK